MRFRKRGLLRRLPAHRHTLTTLAMLTCLGWGQAVAQTQQEAQSPTDAEAVVLKPSERLEENLTSAQRQNAPVFLEGDHLSGRPDLETVIEGNAQLRKADTQIRADRLEYYQPDDFAKATGNVRINRNGNVYTGPLLELKVESFEGFFNEPRYQFRQNDAHGEAKRVDFVDNSRMVIRDATYTTCRRKPGPSWMPDWVLRAAQIDIDNDEEIGVAQGAVLSFKGVPVLPVPAISFPLTDKRKSGVLPPTLDVLNGGSVILPYYWNIAPNRDATVSPNFMPERGVDLGGEFRYLEPGYSGRLQAHYMGNDRLRAADRWSYAYQHQGSVATGIDAIGNVSVSANLNKVSDNNYWRDFTATSGLLTQRLLPSDITAGWGTGGFSTSLKVLRWQTLQDPTAPIVPPYDRAPQWTARFAQTNAAGFDWSVDADYTQFEADRSLTLQPNTQRGFTVMQVSRPWLGAAGFITPKVQLHATTYQFDAPIATNVRSASSVVPTFSLDGGLVFEREASYFGTALLQTLEPRLFYVNTPYRNQSMLPNYDTAANDFNFASFYTENAFGGHDKISDNNLLTGGLTTRLLDPNTGAQFARFGIAQRLRFEEQKVTLTPATPPEPAGLSDVLLGASVNVNDRWALDSTLQYNVKTDRSVRSTVGARYSPSNYRVINVAHRYQRDISEQLDMSWQWPINDLWGDRGTNLGAGRGQGEGRYYSVGRLNYSINESRMVDMVLGVEYDAGCWLGRLVYSRSQTSTTTSTDRLMFQLEFVGFTRLGLSPQSTLTSNISRYQTLRDGGSTSSRFSNYD